MHLVFRIRRGLLAEYYLGGSGSERGLSPSCSFRPIFRLRRLPRSFFSCCYFLHSPPPETRERWEHRLFPTAARFFSPASVPGRDFFPFGRKSILFGLRHRAVFSFLPASNRAEGDFFSVPAFPGSRRTPAMPFSPLFYLLYCSLPSVPATVAGLECPYLYDRNQVAGFLPG